MRHFIKLSSSFERATPLLIMGALALISFSLLKSSPSPSSSPIAVSRTQFDYYLNQFSTAQINENGHLKFFVRGRYAEHSLITKNTLVHDFLFTSSNNSNLYTGQAELADFDDDANKLVMRKNAIIHRLSSKELGTILKSNHLTYSQYPEKLTSEVSVQIEQGNRRTFANSMEYDADKQQMRLSGAVKIKIEPKNK